MFHPASRPIVRSNHRCWLAFCSAGVLLVGCKSVDVSPEVTKVREWRDARKFAHLEQPEAPSTPAAPTARTRWDLDDGKPRFKTPGAIQQASHTVGGEEEIVPALDGHTLPVVRDTGGTLTLGLMDAITAATQSNPRMRVLAFVPGEKGKRADIEYATFDPVLTAGLQWVEGSQQVASALQVVGGGLSQYNSTTIGPAVGAPNVVQVEKRFETGTTARVGLGTTFNQTAPGGQFLIYNPAYTSAINLTVEQPLLRGKDRNVNLAGVRIAKVSEQQANWEFQVELNRTLYEVQRAYWSTWLASSQIQTNQGLVDQAETTLNRERKRFEIGEVGVVEVAQATENLETLKADLEKSRQKLYAAKNQLFGLLGIPANDRRTLELTEQPVLDQRLPDLDEGLATANFSRPELQARQLDIQTAQLEVGRQRDTLRPDLKAYAGYSITGLDAEFLESANRIVGNDFGNWTVGVRYRHVFGFRAEKAAVEQAQLAVSRQVHAREEAEAMVRQQVRESHDNIQATWEVLERQRERAKAARTQMETFTKLHATGQLDLDRLLRARTLLANALREEHIALVDYNLSISSWNYAIGGLTAMEASPPPLMAPVELPPVPADPIPIPPVTDTAEAA